MEQRVQPAFLSPGLDRLLGDERWVRRLQRSRVGVLAHAASVRSSFVHLLDALLAADIKPRLVMGPEHGLRGEAQDMEAVPDGVDPLTGMQVVSLYGPDPDSLAPDSQLFGDVDLVLVDIQDVGSRYYTYVYTAFMVACRAIERGCEVVLLDRPNPLGRAVEGTPLPAELTSFVGWIPGLPHRHGLTPAEVVCIGLRAKGWDSSQVRVVRGSAQPRGPVLEESRLPWVQPSPNMPTLATALVYPGGCLLEATNLSEGRGTTRPFEVVGAPWIDVRAWVEALQQLSLPGVAFRPASFTPTFQKHAGCRCSGLQLHVTDPGAFLPLRTGLALVATAARLHPDAFAWRPDPYEFVRDIPAIDLLTGDPAFREGVEQGASVEALLARFVTSAETRDAMECAWLPEEEEKG